MLNIKQLNNDIQVKCRKTQLADSIKAMKILNSYKVPNASNFSSGLQSPIQVMGIKPRVISFKDYDTDQGNSKQTNKNSLPVLQILSQPQVMRQVTEVVRQRPNISIISNGTQRTVKSPAPKISLSQPTVKKPNNPKPPQISAIFGNRKRKIGVSAKSFIVFDAVTNSCLCQRKSNRRFEIASLTKIMTFYVSLLVIEKLEIDSKKLFIKVTRHASEVIGTSAELKNSDILSLHDLFFGLMLPSGNDAALLIAQALGTILLRNERNQKLYDPNFIDVETLSAEGYYYNMDLRSHEDPIDVFIEQMNIYANKLQLSNTQFASVHGLANRNNYSSCGDLVKLNQECLKHDFFRQVIGCREHYVQTIEKRYIWKNTNKLLDKGFIGIKTGVTENAGPCLASCYKDQNEFFIIIVLNCKNLISRFDETITLLHHGRKKLQMCE